MSKPRYLSLLSAFLCLALLELSTACGGSENSSSQPPPPPSNPVPAILSVSPNSATVGGAAFALTVTGQNFVSSSTVQWNGTSIPTTYGSSSQLQAQISASQISTSGAAAVSVTNPTPGGGNSGSAEFVINATSNPAPSLLSINPSSIPAGSSAFLLEVNGSNFAPPSTIEWNGTPLPTSYLSDTQLEAQVPASDVVLAGFSEITVVTPAPGGGVSSAVTFSATYNPILVNQLANDLVWDSTHQLIYLSVPSLASANGNSIAALDPTTGTITSTQFAGSEPDRLALSDDFQYLYAGIDGSCAVQRFLLPGLSTDINYSLAADPTSGPTYAYDLQVAPGLPDTTAASRSVFNPPSATAGMVIYDDATVRPTTATYPISFYDSLQWASDTTIYANDAEGSSFDLYALTVSPSGVVRSADYLNVFSEFYMSIHYDASTGLVYGDDGTVVNPSTGQRVASFQGSGLMVPDSGLNTAFFLGQTADQFGSSSFTIESFNLTTYAPVNEIVIASVQGNPLHFIRWGANGLAFNDDAGFVYILNNPFVTSDGQRVTTPSRLLRPVRWIIPSARVKRAAQSVGIRPRFSSKVHSSDSNPVPILTAVSPNNVAAGTGNFTLTVSGSNFMSYSVIEWNGTPLPTEYVSSGELQAQVNSSAVVIAGSAAISVSTPSPGGGSSNTLTFAIVSAVLNPAPIIVSLFPDAVTAGSTGFTLDVNGFAYFNASSIVEWNGSPRPATLYSPGQLQVQINASDVATPGFALVTVINPGPGGGTSSWEFQILYQSTVVNQITNDIVWDPVNQVIYVSVPGSAATHANQVCVLNPAIGTIVNCIAAGSDPDVLAISDDSQFLYVGEDGTGSVQRFVLPALTPDISYSLGNYSAGAPYFALDLQVAPGAPHTVAVSKGNADLSTPAVGGITIFDDSTPRPVNTPGSGYPGGGLFSSIQWGSTDAELYAENGESTGYDFYTLTVSSSGVVLDQDYPEVFWNPGRIHYDNGTGLVYSDDGYHAVNPSTGLPAGIFEVGGGWPMAPDSTLNTNFIFSKYVFQENSNYTLSLFDMTHYVPVSRIPISTTQDGLQQLGRFIRWGTNGLAVNDVQGNLYLISGSFVSEVDKSRSPTKR